MARKPAANKKASVSPLALGMHELTQILQSFALIAENGIRKSKIEIGKSKKGHKSSDYPWKRLRECEKVLSLSNWLIGQLGKTNSDVISAALYVGLTVGGINSRDVESARAMYAQSQRSAAAAVRRAEVACLYRELSSDDRKKRETAAKKIHELFKISHPERKWSISMFRRDLRELGH